MTGDDQDPRTKPNTPYSSDGPYDLGTTTAAYHKSEDQRRADHEAAMAKIGQAGSTTSQNSTPTPTPPPPVKPVPAKKPGAGFWQAAGLVFLGLVGFGILQKTFEPLPPSLPPETDRATLPQTPPTRHYSPDTAPARSAEPSAFHKVSLSPSPPNPLSYYLPVSRRDLVVVFGCGRIKGFDECTYKSAYLAAYSLSDGRRLYTLPLPGIQSASSLYAPAYAGDFAAVADHDNIAVYDLRSGLRTASVPIDSKPSLVIIDPDRQQLAIYHQRRPPGSLLRVYNWQTGETLLRLPLLEGAAPSMLFSKDGSHLFFGDNKNDLRVHDLASRDVHYLGDTIGWATSYLGSSSVIKSPLGFFRFSSALSPLDPSSYPAQSDILSILSNKSAATFAVCDLGPDGAVYTVNDTSGSDRIAVFDPDQLRLLRDFPIPGRPEGYLWLKCVGSSPDGRSLYLSATFPSPYEVSLFRLNARPPVPVTLKPE